MSQVVPPSFLFQYTLPMVRADQLPGSASASLRLPSADGIPAGSAEFR